SPSANAEELNKQSKVKRALINDATPPQDLGNIDPELFKGAKFALVDPLPFRDTRGFFAPEALNNTKRLAPDVLAPLELRAAATFVQLKGYKFINERGQIRIGVIRNSTLEGAGAKGDKRGQQDLSRIMRRMNSSGRGAGGPGAPGPTGSPDGPGG